MLRKLFLPIGIVLSIAVAFVWPEPGIGFKALRWGSWFTANNVMILIVFFICGWNVDAGPGIIIVARRRENMLSLNLKRSFANAYALIAEENRPKSVGGITIHSVLIKPEMISGTPS